MPTFNVKKPNLFRITKISLLLKSFIHMKSNKKR